MVDHLVRLGLVTWETFLLGEISTACLCFCLPLTLGHTVKITWDPTRHHRREKLWENRKPSRLTTIPVRKSQITLRWPGPGCRGPVRWLYATFWLAKGSCNYWSHRGDIPCTNPIAADNSDTTLRPVGAAVWLSFTTQSSTETLLKLVACFWRDKNGK